MPPALVARSTLELLAPAGDAAALEAALAAGADAVYFGLTTLNARRRAQNFAPEELAQAVETVHARGARAHLTLNIQLAERELGQAARILELARQCRVDAVLVCDPALWGLRSAYPELEFHLSTQAAATSRADVEAAGRLGANRVVLARELTLAEIAAASAVGVPTEVFVQGALCFSVSGRCLLSSWAGGHSGNRGACTSPCRVPWTLGGQPAGTPLSMHDLTAIGRLGELHKAGVTALKIEGRLKNAAWVGRAVTLYRKALGQTSAADDAGQQPAVEEQLLREAAELAAYSGRAITSGYFDGSRADLTGVAARPGRRGEEPAPEPVGPCEGDDSAAGAEAAGATFDFSIEVEARGIVCRCTAAGRTTEWTIPKTVVHRAHKAVPIGNVLEILGAGPMHDCELRHATTNDPEFLMVPRAVNALMDRVGKVIRQSLKQPGDMVRIDLPEAVRELLNRTEPHEANRRTLGDRPDRVRIAATDVGVFTRQVRPEALVVEGVTTAVLDRVLAAARDLPVIVALPPVFFEGQIPRLQALLARCKTARLSVEVNSWGGWRLAQEAGVRMESGPGLGVLNSLAAGTLRGLGIRCVTLSVEADRRQLEELTAHCPSPCSLVVFGRPPLLTTRVRLPDSAREQVFEDRRSIRMTVRGEEDLLVFRPVEPFDLRDLKNERIHAAHLVADLAGCDDPLAAWHELPDGKEGVFRFNYDRTLA
jgi:collagenase-like PrtC family protease